MAQPTLERIAYLFVRAAEKFNQVQATPVRMRDGTTVYGAEMHMAVAIGEGRARTATELGTLFNVTRGAVSQAVNRLEAKGIILRASEPGDAKKLVITLTAKGRKLAALHERLHGVNAEDVEAAASAFGREKLAAVEEFLLGVSEIMDGLIERVKEKRK